MNFTEFWQVYRNRFLLAFMAASFVYLLYIWYSDRPVKEKFVIEQIRQTPVAKATITPDVEAALSSENTKSSREFKQRRLGFILIGTLEADQSVSRAWVRIDGKTHNQERAIGEKISGHKLVLIGPGYIEILRYGKRERILVDERRDFSFEIDTNALIAQVLHKYVSEEDLIDGGTKVLDIKRSDLQSILKNQAQMAKGLRAKPRLYKEKIEGYNIMSLNADHFFYKLGARSGDVIYKVNGLKLTGTAILFELWKHISTAPNIEVEIHRKGKLVKFFVNVFD